MVYKRYVKKRVNGEIKTFGPYYYESKKENGKVISTYIGTKPPKTLKSNKKLKKIISNKYFLLGVLFIFLLALANFIFLIELKPTGDVSINLGKDFSEGEYLRGNLKLNIVEGELIPAETSVLFYNSDKVSEFTLSDLLDNQTVEGNFFLRQKNLEGSGAGFGVAGKGETFPEFSFNAIIPETQEEISGNVSATSPFEYELEENQTLEILSSEHPVEIKIEKNIATISTDYKETKSGFGEEFLGEDVSFTIDLSKLELRATDGLLKIVFAYKDIELFSAEEKISLKKTQAEEPTGPIATQTQKTQKQAIVGEPVAWSEKINANSDSKLKVNIPKKAFDLEVKENSKDVTFEEQDTSSSKEVLIDATKSNAYEIEYKTPAPEISEEKTNNGKKVTVSSEISYENVLAFTSIDESLDLKDSSMLKIFWVEQNKYIPVSSLQDKNSNGVYDYVEWIVPHLSNQTFNIIVITKAEHLDGNRNFIKDIYDEVKELDDVWSETISSGEFVRVTFEKQLNSSNDITLYPKIISGEPKIEVYEEGGDQMLVEFTNLSSEEYNKVFLINLGGLQDTFDLRILDGSLQFDHIVDPPPAKTAVLSDVSFVENTTALNEGDTFTITSTYDNSGDDSGSWVIQLQSTNFNSVANNIDGACSTGEGFRIVSIDVSSCGGVGTCTADVTTGTATLTNLHKNDNNNIIIWTLQACDWSGSYDPYTIRTIRVSGDTALFRLQTNPISINLIANHPPQIISVGPIPSVGPIESSIRTVNFEVQVRDTDGYTDITSVSANFSMAGESDKTGTCTFQNNLDFSTAVYSCSIDMQYYDKPGDWTVSVESIDSSSDSATDNSQIFVYQSLMAIVISPSSINWPTVNPGATNQLPSNFTTINNTGNYEGPIYVTSYNLAGLSDSTIFPVNSFTAGITSGSECSATQLQDSTLVQVAGSNLPRGPIATEEIYYCIPQVPLVPSQQYSTSASGSNSWTISI